MLPDRPALFAFTARERRMLVRLLSTARQIVALISFVCMGCLTGPTIVCVVATRFLIHRYASVNSVDESNAADDVPQWSTQRDSPRE